MFHTQSINIAMHTIMLLLYVIDTSSLTYYPNNEDHTIITAINNNIYNFIEAKALNTVYKHHIIKLGSKI